MFNPNGNVKLVQRINRELTPIHAFCLKLLQTQAKVYEEIPE